MPVFSKSAAVAVIAFLATSAQGHMMMASPVPYGKSTLNNFPLAADGSDFPCKQRTGVYDAEGASNVAVIGAPQTLSFIGGATHGGGSCQVSLTTDLQPTKDSKWMVVKSIEGGCPSDSPGNLNDDAKSTAATKFQYTIPEGVAPGDYTVAWTWFNHIGNREMYMNCGPMTVTAPKKKRYAPEPKFSKRDSPTFPDMFKANIGNGCSTPESFDYVFPNPGADVQTAGKGPFTTLSCANGAGSGPAQQPTGSAAPAAGSAPAPTDSPAAPSASTPNNGQYTAGSASAGGFASGATSVATPAPAALANTDSPQVIPVDPGQTMNTPAPSAPAGTAGSVPTAAAPAAPAASSSTGSTSGAAGLLTGACSDEGDWNCIDGSSFQRCASGAWSVAIPMSGMKCTPGKSSSFSMTAGRAKRFFNA